MLVLEHSLGLPTVNAAALLKGYEPISMVVISFRK